ncbi:MAG: OmpA family protein [Myxococcota bacterium]
MTSMCPRTALALALALSLPSLAGREAVAQQASATFSLERFDPQATQGINVLTSATSDILGHAMPAAGIFATYANSPLTAAYPDGSEESLVDDRVSTHVWASLGLFDVGELSVALPIIAAQSGADLGFIGRPGEQVASRAVGDIVLTPKLQLWDGSDRRFFGFGAALTIPVYVPTGDESSFASDGALRVAPRLALDWRARSGLLVTTNVGYHIRPERTVRNVVSDDRIDLSVAVRTPVGVQGLSVLGDIYGSLSLATDAPGEAPNASQPFEAAVALQYDDLPANLAIQLGAGGGLNGQVGSSSLRMFASLSYTPRLEARDDAPAPASELRVTETQPPEQADEQEPVAEAPVDEDIDAIMEDEVLDEAVVDDAAAEALAQDEAPAEDVEIEAPSESVADMEDDDDEDMTFEEDNVEEIVRPEPIYTGGRPMVMIEADQATFQPLYYDMGELGVDTVEHRPALDTVASMMKSTPSITLLRISGYTDDVGPSRKNRRISKRRAEDVRAYLIERGVSPERLEVVGAGEQRPQCGRVDEIKTTKELGDGMREELRECRSLNRRVELEIVEFDGRPARSGGPAQ